MISLGGVLHRNQLLSQIVSPAVDDGLLKALPWSHITIPRIQRKEARFLMQSQVTLLTDAVDPRYCALVTVGAYCGPRIGEIAGLRWSDIDLNRYGHLFSTSDADLVECMNLVIQQEQGKNYEQLCTYFARCKVRAK
ncbi:MAG: hypothetical protein M1399_06170 [Actinobacteria bacterium]|nr:hypothetical protein [Actinomycetota bacterium]MCL5447151.1 hypothetical protein [Actinomycetota bacterium]